MHHTLLLAVKSYFSYSPLCATVHFCILFTSPYLKKQVCMQGPRMFLVENKIDLLLEKICWRLLTCIVIAILVIAWLPRQPGQPGSKSQPGRRRMQPGTAFVASFCQKECILNCLQAGRHLVTSGCRAGTVNEKLHMAKAEMTWDKICPAFLSTDDTEWALTLPTPFRYPWTLQPGLRKIKTDMMCTIKHITPQEQRLWAAGTLARLSTWPPCPCEVRRDPDFPLSVPHPWAEVATAMQRTREVVKERGSKVVPGVSQKQPGQCRKPWGPGQFFIAEMSFLSYEMWWHYWPFTVLKVTCSKNTKHGGTLYSYISHAGTSCTESFTWATPGKVFAPFCFLGGSCHTQGYCLQCSAVVLALHI